MSKKISGKVKKYHGYATFLRGKLKDSRSEKVRGILQILRGKAMEVL